MKNIREDIDEVLARTEYFYNAMKPGSALIKCNISVANDGKAKTMDAYDLKKDMEKIIDDRFSDTYQSWYPNRVLHDDTVPSFYSTYGIADLAGYLGGHIDYGPHTSWLSPTMDSVRELDKVVFDENNDSYKLVIGSIKYIAEKYGDIFFPKIRGTMGITEVANMLRGSDYFYDFCDDPEGLHILHEALVEPVKKFVNKQLEAAGGWENGMVTGFGFWLPGKGIGQLSEDDTLMISLEMYEEFGRPYTQKVIDDFDIAMMHVHSVSENYIDSIAQTEKLKIMEISADPNTDKPINIVRRHQNTFRKVIPAVGLSFDEIKANLDLLKTIPSIITSWASSVEEAEEIIKFVRKELPIV